MATWATISRATDVVISTLYRQKDGIAAAVTSFLCLYGMGDVIVRLLRRFSDIPIYSDSSWTA